MRGIQQQASSSWRYGLWAAVFLLLSIVTSVLAAPKFEPLHAFESYPSDPQAPLIQGRDGNFYGTTVSGGCYGYGTVFKMTSTGKLTILTNFDYEINGDAPGTLIQGRDGNFYGTTGNGGGGGSGTAFKVTPDGELTTLVTFYPEINGESPSALIQGRDGNFYGTTYGGGTYYCGTIFKLTPEGILTTLVNYNGINGDRISTSLVQGSDDNLYGATSSTVFKLTLTGDLTILTNFEDSPGSGPNSLMLGRDGNFYGTTSEGGSRGKGTVFKMTPAGNLTTLVNFNGTNGDYPQKSLIQGSDGSLYGTTNGGGSHGYGTVFKVTPVGGLIGATLTTLVNFDATNGHYPCAGLIQASDGNFYGTTCADYTHGGNSGTVFKMTPAGKLTTLQRFQIPTGRYLDAALIQGKDGDFYGTTYAGGSHGYGTVFKLSSAGKLTTLMSFDGNNGEAPNSSLIQGSDGNFYGTTRLGGSSKDNGYGYGTVFRVTPSGKLTTLVSFNNTNGAYPQGALIQESDGNFYGMTSYSGGNEFGRVFKLTPAGVLTTLVNFDGSNSGYPPNSMLQGRDGNIYWMADGLFKLTPYGVLTKQMISYPINTININGLITLGNDGNFYGTSHDAGGGYYSRKFFKLTTEGNLTIIANFEGPDRSNSFSPLIQGRDGNFYGTTYDGGNSGDYSYGTVFKLTPAGILTTLVDFNYTNGANPIAELIQGRDGHFYGTTTRGGSSPDGILLGGGQIFRLWMGAELATTGVSGVSSSHAVLSGTVHGTTDLKSNEIPVTFRYSMDPALATYSSLSAGTIPAGSTDVAVSASLSDLQPGTTYYYRIVTSSVDTGELLGDILSFTTRRGHYPGLIPAAFGPSRIVRNEDSLIVGFKGVAQRSYRIQRSTGGVEWETLGDVVTDTAGKASYTDNDPAAEKSRYRMIK